MATYLMTWFRKSLLKIKQYNKIKKNEGLEFHNENDATYLIFFMWGSIYDYIEFIQGIPFYS